MTEGRATEITLYGCGRMSWPDLYRATSTCDAAAWADYDGFHIGRFPDTAPPYTHLWAWAEQWLLRARVDGAHAIVGVLASGEAIPDQITPVSAWPVRCTTRYARTWPADEQRVGQIPAAVSDRAVEIWQVDGDRPVTFVRVR